jgi:hypothetical protein
MKPKVLRMRKILSMCIVLLVAGSLAGCVVTERFTARRVIGSIPNHPQAGLEVIRAPERVAVNQEVEITVITYGSSSCITPDGADVEVTGHLAVVTPYDRVPTGEVACTADLASHPRPVRLTFAEGGPALIRVMGAPVDGVPVTHERQITVTP